MYICVLAALKWKHCDAIHDTQALKLATDNTGEMGNHGIVLAADARNTLTPVDNIHIFNLNALTS